jgi:hypothetical protein
MMERYPNLKEKIDSSILGCEISSLLDQKLVKWSTASCALALTCWPSLSPINNNHNHNNNNNNLQVIVLYAIDTSDSLAVSTK